MWLLFLGSLIFILGFVYQQHHFIDHSLLSVCISDHHLRFWAYFVENCSKMLDTTSIAQLVWQSIKIASFCPYVRGVTNNLCLCSLKLKHQKSTANTPPALPPKKTMKLYLIKNYLNSNEDELERFFHQRYCSFFNMNEEHSGEILNTQQRD